jgi:hypothetical protein
MAWLSIPGARLQTNVFTFRVIRAFVTAATVAAGNRILVGLAMVVA